MTVIATAGHVDHGKSSLVAALTGTDPDRWAEEKARGLTIDLGFATMGLPSGREVSFIDVPGHIRFLRNMLAGVGAVDACLFVVDAAEGWKPQSEEHLRILALLGLDRGVIALTKIDTGDDDLRELAELDVDEHVEGTFLARAPVVGVSSVTGEGLDDLVAALDTVLDGATRPASVGDARLWIDRSFAPAGAGTVVTGTVLNGPIAVGDELHTVPGDRTVRVRTLQSHHRGVDRIGPGNRAALNLSGVAHHDLARGDVLVAPGAWHLTRSVDAELSVLTTLPRPVGRRGAYAAYVGSAELQARLRVIGGDEIGPGEVAPVRLWFDRPMPLRPGDRYILRESGRDVTVGGGQILDVDPVLPLGRAAPDRSVRRVVAERGWVDVDQLRLLTGEETPPTVDRWVVDDEVLAVTVARVGGLIAAAGPLGLDIAALDERERAVIDRVPLVRLDAGRATIGEPVDPLVDHPWLAALEAAPFTPPGPDGVDRAEVRALVRRGRVVERDGVFFAATAVDDAARRLARVLTARPDGVTVAEVRDLLGTTRKYALALLSHLDGTGITRRRDDLRIAGPRMPDGSEQG
ncbi:MAG: selenocysteine-specific translation elongation factor [Acidimicrobiales bacterium]